MFTCLLTDRDCIIYFYMREEQKLGLQFITEWTRMCDIEHAALTFR